MNRLCDSIEHSEDIFCYYCLSFRSCFFFNINSFMFLLRVFDVKLSFLVLLMNSYECSHRLIASNSILETSIHLKCSPTYFRFRKIPIRDIKRRKIICLYPTQRILTYRYTGSKSFTTTD